MTPCSLLSCRRRFGGTYRLHLQGNKARCLPCWLLLNYFFDPEDGGDMFLRNVSCNSRRHGVISQKMIFFITTAVDTSNSTDEKERSYMQYCNGAPRCVKHI
jgi:hypothetical protein